MFKKILLVTLLSLSFFQSFIPAFAKDKFIIPFSNSSYVDTNSMDILSTILTLWQLKAARNEIYARHGKKFNSLDLQCYFNTQSWYKVNPNYSDNLLNNFEKKNTSLILDYEKKVNSNVTFTDMGCIFGQTQASFDIINKPIEGLSRACKEKCGKEMGGKWGFIDEKGNIIVEPKYSCVMPFSEGLAAVTNGSMFEGPYGFIDKTGTMVIQPKFSFVQHFSEGLAAVCEGKCDVQPFCEGNWGFIDKSGNYVIPPKYDTVGSFSNGSASFRINKNHYYLDVEGRIDKTGKVLESRTAQEEELVCP